jgi:hypothetical protein
MFTLVLIAIALEFVIGSPLIWKLKSVEETNVFISKYIGLFSKPLVLVPFTLVCLGIYYTQPIAIVVMSFCIGLPSLILLGAKRTYLQLTAARVQD